MDIGEVRSSILLISTKILFKEPAIKMEKTNSNSVEIGYVYILQSRINSRFYVGSTIEINKRLSEHNNGYVKSTRNMRPWELKFYKKFDSIRNARQIEFKIKKLKSRKIIERIILEQELKLTI